MSATTQRRRGGLSDAEREARRQAERELMQQAVDALAGSDGWQRWLRTRSAFHRYSLSNQLLIAMQRPDATRVASFRGWLKLGYCVQKSEHAIRIWVPMPPTKAQLTKWETDGADPKTKPRVRFKLGSVFDRSQVAPLPDFPDGPADLDPPDVPVDGDSHAHLLEPLVQLGAEIGSAVTVERVPGEARGFYEVTSRRIVIDVISETFSPNAQIATLVHELSHALVRADREEGDPALDYAQEEVLVETVAFCVCASMGLDTGGASVPYVAGWAGGDSDLIHQHARLIDRLARRIEDAIESTQT
jgi:antirestriction protein ArdC